MPPDKRDMYHIYKPRNAKDCQKLKETRKDPPLEPLEGAWPRPLLNFRLLVSRTRREEMFVVLATLWNFVMAATENSHTLFSPHRKRNLTWVVDIKVKAETKKHLNETLEKILVTLG